MKDKKPYWKWAYENPEMAFVIEAVVMISVGSIILFGLSYWFS